MSKHCPSFIIWVHLRWTMWHVLVRIQNGGSSSENANHPTAKSGPFSIWVASQSGDLNRTFLWVRPCDDEVIDCLDKNNGGKAYRSGKSLLHSEHLSNVMTHNISNNIRYTFVCGYCFPEQQTSNKPYDVWVCLHKDTGNIVEGACSCVAGWVLS